MLRREELQVNAGMEASTCAATITCAEMQKEVKI